MKRQGNKFKKDQIVVCTKTQYYGCGATRLREGAIVKIKHDTDQDDDYVHVYRRVDSKDVIYAKTAGLRLATEEEITQFANKTTRVHA